MPMRAKCPGNEAIRCAREMRKRRVVAAPSAAYLIAVSAFLGILSFLGQDAMAGTWDIQTVDSAGNVGQYTSIAVNGSGPPRIGYQDVTNADVKYAKWAGGSWEIETVDSFGF